MDRLKEISERYSILRRLGSSIVKPTIEDDCRWLLEKKLQRHFEHFKIFEDHNPARGYSIGFQVFFNGNEHAWSCNEEYFDGSPVIFHEIASEKIHDIISREGLTLSPPNET